MSDSNDSNDSDWKTKAAVAAGAAVGSAAIAAALLFVKRRRDKSHDSTKENQPPATGKAPYFPPETD